MLEKQVDLILDRRNPLFILQNYLEKKEVQNRIIKTQIPQYVEIAITFDVEHDYGLQGGSDSTISPFLSEIQKTLGKKIPSTFFVQGNLIEKYCKTLIELENAGHEIGLHGWGHEQWGNAWFLKGTATTEVKQLLEKSIRKFEKCGLRKPVSFRAPYMVLSKENVMVLEKYGFTIDSSAQSFRGEEPLIKKMRNVYEIPVSADPIPIFKSNGT
ncbi:MAG: polysaccharide deacetylase family protein, partial [Candidatus ainarchaeum sp.]|nr:polysaccharide deacetylase family protein [Candidatus ainarchaeum sp.]